MQMVSTMAYATTVSSLIDALHMQHIYVMSSGPLAISIPCYLLHCPCHPSTAEQRGGVEGWHQVVKRTIIWRKRYPDAPKYSSDGGNGKMPTGKIFGCKSLYICSVKICPLGYLILSKESIIGYFISCKRSLQSRGVCGSISEISVVVEGLVVAEIWYFTISFSFFSYPHLL